MEATDVLRERVNVLIKRYTAVLNERNRLKKELAMLRAEKEELQVQLQRTDEKRLAIQIGKAMPDEHARAQSRKQIDAVISEIDKILTTINE